MAAFAIALGTFGLGAVAPAPAAAEAHDAAGIGIALVDAPSDRLDDPRARTAIIDHLQPGSSIERRVRVSNHTDDEVTVDLSPGAARIRDGAFVADGTNDGNDLTTWTSVSPSSVRIPPGGETMATVRIIVPADAYGGERYGAVWARPPAARSGGIAVVNRVGVRVYLSVGGPEEPISDLTLGAITASRDGTSPQLGVEVANTGERALDLDGVFTLVDDATRLQAGPFAADRRVTLAPGDRAVLHTVLPAALAAGPWTVTATATAGTIERSVTGVVTIPTTGSVHVGDPLPPAALDPSATAVMPVPGPTSSGGPPVLPALAALAAIAAVGGAALHVARSAGAATEPAV